MPPRKKKPETAPPSGDAPERISIREASRRMGVTDATLHRYKDLGVIKIVGYTPERGWPLVAWPDVKNDYEAYVNTRMQRSNMLKAQRAEKKASEEEIIRQSKQAERERRAAEFIPAPQRPPPSPDLLDMGTATLADSRALHEQYKAKLARVEYEEKIKTLVAVDKVKADAFNMARIVREELMNIPDRLANELAYETDPTQVHMMISNEIRDVLEKLADLEQ